MVWSHYLQETTNNQADNNVENTSDDDELAIPRNRPLDFDMWVTWFHNDLLNMWMSLRAYREDSSTTHFILDECEFHDFCEFCYEFSSRFASRYPS